MKSAQGRIIERSVSRACGFSYLLIIFRLFIPSRIPGMRVICSSGIMVGCLHRQQLNNWIYIPFAWAPSPPHQAEWRLMTGGSCEFSIGPPEFLTSSFTVDIQVPQLLLDGTSKGQGVSATPGGLGGGGGSNQQQVQYLLVLSRTNTDRLLQK